MKIKKLGHSCFVAEPKEGVYVMTDPGAFSPTAKDVRNISAILITHEHQDHMHIETLKKVLENNPDANVDILALPITAPWMKIKDAVDYAKNINPRIIFPVHDAHIHEWANFIWRVPENILKDFGIEFKKLELGKEENL